MNIALFSSSFYPHIGGVEEACRQLAHAYQGRGVGVIVITNRWPMSLAAEDIYEGVAVYRIEMRIPEGDLKARIKYLLKRGSVLRQLYQILRRHKTDLIHVQCVSVNGHYALSAHREMQLPLVVTTHGERTMDAGRLFERSGYMKRILISLLDSAKWVTACSAHTLHDAENFYGASLARRASVVYSGVHLPDFDGPLPDAPHGRAYILGMGRLVPQKGFDVLIRAFAIANLSGHELVIAGEGPERAALETMIDEWGLANRVRFFGAADRRAAVALFHHCDFFILPSRQEPMGIVNLEAMAAGKAVVASRVGGVPELVIDELTGLLVPPEDPDALAAAIARLAKNPQLSTRLGTAGRVRVQSFGWAKIADEFIDLYQQILELDPKSQVIV